MKGVLALLGLLALAGLQSGCSSKLERGVNWCKQNYSGYTRDDCIRQMQRNLDGT